MVPSVAESRPPSPRPRLLTQRGGTAKVSQTIRLISDRAARDLNDKSPRYVAPAATGYRRRQRPPASSLTQKSLYGVFDEMCLHAEARPVCGMLQLMQRCQPCSR